MIAAKTLWIMEDAALNPPIYIETILTSKWKSKDMLHGRRGYTFTPQEMRGFGFIPH